MEGFTKMMLFGLSLVAVTMALPKYDARSLPLDMTTEELQRTFQTTADEYEVVYPEIPRLQRRSARSGMSIRLNAFGKNINLWLHPTEGSLVAYDTPVYRIKSTSEKPGFQFARLTNAMEIVGNMLEDREKRATFMVKRSADGRSLISGNIASEDLVIKPFPSHLADENFIGKNKGSIEFLNDTIGEYHEPYPHAIFRGSKLPKELEYMDRDFEKGFLGQNASRSKRSSSEDVIYPQILSIVDYDTYAKHGKSDAGILEYLLPFWNSVNLRYRSLQYPKVRINIAGIIIAEDPKALPYMTPYKIDAGTLNIFGALEKFSFFMPKIESLFPFPQKYDIAVTSTTLMGCSPQKDNTCRTGTLGLAYVSSACVDYNVGSENSRIQSVAIFQDKGGYDGVSTAAHEIGHLFGANHDGEEGSLCDGNAGHIMTPTSLLTENMADWSKCTLKEFENFFDSETSKCLLNVPKPLKSSLPLVLPGKVLTLDEQCARIEGTRTCNDNLNPCMTLKCIYKKDSEYCVTVGSAGADGSKCDKDKICLHGKCINEKLIGSY